MFKNNHIGLVYRVICLITFVFVILFSKSYITLALLAIFFFFVTKNDNDFFFIFLYIISLLSFAIAYFSNSFILLKIAVIIEYSYYFLNIPRTNKVINDKVNKYLDKRLNIEKEEEKKEKGESIEKKEKINETEIDYLRFTASRKTAKVEKKESNIIPTLYLVVHLFILFISIAVG